MKQRNRVEFFRNGKLQFDVSDEGPINGTIVLLLHGFPQNYHCWDGVRRALHTSGHRTITFDQRGYAPRARPRGRFAYRAKALASDVSTLIDLLKPHPISIVGHDWGALVAWTVAATRPESVTSRRRYLSPTLEPFLRSLLSSDQSRRAIYMALCQLPWLPEVWIRGHRRAFGAVLSGTGMAPPEVDRVIMTSCHSKHAPAESTGTGRWRSHHRAVRHRCSYPPPTSGPPVTRHWCVQERN